MICSLSKTLLQSKFFFKTLLSEPSSLRTIISTITTSTNQHSFTVSYLINSCGFTPNSALSASKYLHLKTPTKPDSVLAFFKTHGFTETQVLNLIKRVPTVILSKPEKTLLPKFNFFHSIGFSSSDLAKTLSSNPTVLRRSLENQIIPSFNFFKSLLHDNAKIVAAYKRFPGIFLQDPETFMAPNITILREFGVPQSNIATLLVYQPRAFIARSDSFREIVEEVMRMGFNPLRMKFVLAVHAMRAMSKSIWERKVEVYKKWNWSEKEVLVAFGKHPWCMTTSEDKIMAVMDYFVNKMGWKASIIAHRPVLMSLSLEKRIVPRCEVVRVLLSKGLIRKDISLYALLESPEKLFLQKFVACYEEEAPQLLKVYREKMDLSRV